MVCYNVFVPGMHVCVCVYLADISDDDMFAANPCSAAVQFAN